MQASATPDQGAALFKRACAGCHTLNAADTNARGGDLAQDVLPIQDLVSFERIMPVKLTPAQIYSVAIYLHTIEAKTKTASS